MKLALRTGIESLRATLTLPPDTEHRKLPKDSSPLSTLINPTWRPYITSINLPTHMACSYNTLTAKTKLHKHYKYRPLPELNGSWPILNVIYDTL
jgi:hypothetical protein